jgi:CheY-like chemotaxis protein
MNDTKQDRPPLVAIIDDEEDIILFLRVALEDHGYGVVATSDPSEALALLERSGPDMICLDLVMPGQTGISLYAELVDHPRLGGVPIVILSGLAVREEMSRIFQEAGGLPEPASFIEKPVDIEQFLSVVTELVGPVGTVVP